MVWARHESDAKWHTGGRGASSFITHCFGRWSLTDTWQTSASPPHEDRCPACQRLQIDVGRVDRGLVELAARAPAPRDFDWPGPYEFDLGGES